METELLSNHDLVNYCKMLKMKLNDVNYKDKMKIDKDGCYIINLDHSSPLDGYNGTHWVALYIKQNEALYYDSYGIRPPPIIIQKLKKYNPKLKLLCNANQFQHMKSIYCGWYCLLFLYLCSKNPNAKMRTKMNKYKALFHYDTPENRNTNDEILKRHIKRIFSNIN